MFPAHFDQFVSTEPWTSVCGLSRCHDLAHSSGLNYTGSNSTTRFNQAHLRCGEGTANRGRGLRGPMSTHPTQIWKQLPVELQQCIQDDLSSILQEVIHDYI